MSEVGEETEGRDPLVGGGAVDFCENVRSSRSPSNDYEWSEVPGLGLPAMAGLDSRVANENKSAGFEIVVLDDMFVVFDELCDGLVLGLLDLSSDVLEIFVSLRR